MGKYTLKITARRKYNVGRLETTIEAYPTGQYTVYKPHIRYDGSFDRPYVDGVDVDGRYSTYTYIYRNRVIYDIPYSESKTLEFPCELINSLNTDSIDLNIIDNQLMNIQGSSIQSYVDKEYISRDLKIEIPESGEFRNVIIDEGYRGKSYEFFNYIPVESGITDTARVVNADGTAGDPIDKVVQKNSNYLNSKNETTISQEDWVLAMDGIQSGLEPGEEKVLDTFSPQVGGIEIPYKIEYTYRLERV